MKKLRLFALFCVVVMSAAMMTSCNMLDEIKDVRVEYKDDKREIIEYKGKQYKQIDNPRELTVSTNELRCFLVKNDVPLLLTRSKGEWCGYNEKFDIIDVFGDYYCSAEKFSKYTDIFKNAVLDRYSALSYHYDEDQDMTVSEHLMFNDDEMNLINETIKNVESKTLDDSYDYWMWERISVDKCDKDGMFFEYSVLELYKDAQKNVYGILVGNDTLYEFSNEHKNTLEKMFEKYGESYDMYYPEEIDYSLF